MGEHESIPVLDRWKNKAKTYRIVAVALIVATLLTGGAATLEAIDYLTRRVGANVDVSLRGVRDGHLQVSITNHRQTPITLSDTMLMGRMREGGAELTVLLESAGDEVLVSSDHSELLLLRPMLAATGAMNALDVDGDVELVLSYSDGSQRETLAPGVGRVDDEYVRIELEKWDLVEVQIGAQFRYLREGGK